MAENGWLKESSTLKTKSSAIPLTPLKNTTLARDRTYNLGPPDLLIAGNTAITTGGYYAFSYPKNQGIAIKYLVKH
jgi:hypothetical protein